MNLLKVGFICTDQINSLEDCNKLNFNAKGILKALINSKQVDSIYVLNLNTVDKSKKKFSFLLFINKSLKFFSNKFFFYFEKILANIENYDTFVDKAQITNEEYKIFLNKFKKKIILDQVTNNLTSKTQVSKELSDLELDFLVRGSGLKIEKGEILNKGSKYGVVSIHHGLNSKNRGGPVGFWECFYQQNSGITIQLLSKELDGGKTLSRFIFSSATYTFANRINIYSYTYVCFLSLLNKLSVVNLFQQENYLHNLSSLYTNKILKQPTLIAQKFLALKLLSFFFIKILKKIRFETLKFFKINPDVIWSVYMTNNTMRRLENWNKIRPLNNNDFFADPFLLKIENNVFVIMEKYEYHKKKGEIVYFNLDQDKIIHKRERKLISNDMHLSYPFTFSKNNKSYLIPENNNKGLYLYEINSDEHNILIANKIKKLLSGNYAEPTIIRHNETDYLFVNLENRSILEIYYTKNIVSDPLKPHPMNPVMIDSKYARSAGRMFIYKNEIYRPSQNCLKKYGEGIYFSKIQLSTNFFESYPADYKIKTTKELKLVHHFDYLDDLTVIDGVIK